MPAVDVGSPSTGGVSVKVGSEITGVEVAVASKIAVWVRLGVGNVKGVGEDAPGNVHALTMIASSMTVKNIRDFSITSSMKSSHVWSILHLNIDRRY